MSFLNKYRTDKVAEEVGVWVTLDEEISIKVARMSNKAAKDLRNKLEKPYRQMSKIPDHVLEEILIKVTAQAVIRDWEGITDENGKVIPYSPSAAEKLLTEYSDFLSDVVTAAIARETFQTEGVEAVKNG